MTETTLPSDAPAAPGAGGVATGAGRMRVEQGQKWVRAYLNGHVVADTRSPLMVWELPYFPTYYFPVDDVVATLVPAGSGKRSPSRGESELFDVTIAGATAPGAALRYPDSPIEALRGAVRLDWDAMDEWFEEDEPVYTHPRNPYHRVDILGSSRRVEVLIDEVLVADSNQPRILFETGLPPRYYLPLTDVRLDLLRPSPTVTHCPYKGAATYWSIKVAETLHPDLVWIYRAPLPESQKIAGLACFYNEKVDIRIDGVLQDRPHTPFS
ncbi:MAG: hypothetical protein QOF20_3312 [Acidimicrobiaceae bacterium]|nr:hypothetical protein [Acidimicrobiaceae bacterium]MDQ1370959.1 hypothetical protein [Acidimicrobiaceae bacterium]